MRFQLHHKQEKTIAIKTTNKTITAIGDNSTARSTRVEVEARGNLESPLGPLKDRRTRSGMVRTDESKGKKYKTVSRFVGESQTRDRYRKED